jgi:KDO2-lipid IV(A) lauroyltransferase
MSGVRMLAKTLKKVSHRSAARSGAAGRRRRVGHFFGRPAYTMTLPAKLAQLGDATIIVTYAERLPGGRGYVIRFVPFEGTLEGSAAEQAQTINHAMERLIARCPAQYFWSYNRYKVPAGIDARQKEHRHEAAPRSCGCCTGCPCLYWAASVI